METKDLERVQEDIDIIKESAGLDLRFGWEAVWGNMVLIPILAIWELVYYLAAEKPTRFGLSIPWVVLFIVMIYLR